MKELLNRVMNMLVHPICKKTQHGLFIKTKQKEGGELLAMNGLNHKIVQYTTKYLVMIFHQWYKHWNIY